jgi:SulP family sulfate permease
MAGHPGGMTGDMWVDAASMSSARVAEEGDGIRETAASRQRKRKPSFDDTALGDYSELTTYKDFQKSFGHLYSSMPEHLHEHGNHASRPIWGALASDMVTAVRRLGEKARFRFKECCGPGWMSRMSRALPFLHTMRGYSKHLLGADVSAGLAEGIMCIPMGMSYALLANVPAVYGLYTGLVPSILYLLLGSCAQLSLGVSAIESLLTGEAVANVIGFIGDEAGIRGTTQDDIDAKVQVTICMTLAVGFWHLVMRILNMGMVATLLADPVLNGFSTASAFLIATSQLNHLLGLDLKSGPAPVVWVDALVQLPSANVTAMIVGVGGIILLWALKRLNTYRFPKVSLPIQLVLVVISTAISAGLNLDEPPYNVKVLGVIPSGLPNIGVPSFPTVNGISFQDALGQMVVQSLVLAIMTYVITISVGKTFAMRNEYTVDANQELLAMGGANVIGPFFQTFVASASLSRTSVIDSIGSKTVLHGAFSVAVLAITLVALTPTLYYLPKATLSSVVLFGVFRMMDFSEARELYHISKPDFGLWLVCFSVTLLGGAIYGIAISVLISLVWVLMKSSRPKAVVLGRLPGSNVYRNIKRFPMAREIHGVRIFRFDASLHFANKDYFEAKMKILDKTPGMRGEQIRTIIVDASAINDLDTSAIRTVTSLAEDFSARGVRLLFANWKGPQRDTLEKSGFFRTVPPENIFLSLPDAVAFARKVRGADEEEKKEEGGAEKRVILPAPAVADELRPGLEIQPGGGEKVWAVGLAHHPSTQSMSSLPSEPPKTEQLAEKLEEGLGLEESVAPARRWTILRHLSAGNF